MFKRFAQCVGLSSMILVMNYGEMLGGGQDVRMHVPYRLTGIVLAQIADILLLGLVLFAFLELSRRTRFYSVIKAFVAIAIPPYLLIRTRALFPFQFVEGMLPIVAIAWAGIVLLLILRFRRLYKPLLKLGDIAGVFLFVFACCSMLQMLWVIRWKPEPNQYAAAWSTTAQPPRQHPRLVWVVFDELSYDQTFEHRAHDLPMPAFDALRAESTLFTNVQPIGYKTVKILPSLLGGRTVDDFRFGYDNQVRVHYTDERGWHGFGGPQSIFADAQKAGWRTAVVGWYNPYCTIYKSAIDDCYWMNLDKIDGPMAQQNPFWTNVYAPLQQVVREIKAPTRADRDSCSADVRQRLKTHLDLRDHLFTSLSTDQADFTFVHLSLPHSPNIWSRIDDAYTQWCDSSYIDNLALVDRTLARILATLKQSPRWADTTLIIQGDHSWRVDLWDWLPAWTDEDDAASHDKFDPRPAVLIHQAGQTTAATVSTPWSLLKVHEVAEQVLRGDPAAY